MNPGAPSAARLAVAFEPAAVEPFITKGELARRLGTSVATVDGWMEQGIVPFYKPKFSVRFRWSEVQRHWWEHYRVCARRPLPGGCNSGETRQ